MARLPVPGADSGTWGDILNEYLSQTLNTDGTLKTGVVTSSVISPNAITAVQIADGTITEAQLDTDTQNKLNTAGSGNVADGTITTAKLHDDAVSADKIQDGAITNVHVNSSAAIAQSKVANLTTDLAGKAAAVHTHTAAQISDSTAIGRTLVMAADGATVRAAIGAGTSSLAIGTTASTAKAGNYQPTANDIIASGSPTSTTFLRGDATWATPDLSDNRLGFCQSEAGSSYYSGFDSETIESIVSGVKAAGGSWLRVAAWWGEFEPTTRGNYDWAGLDRVLGLCETYNLEPIVGIVGSPVPQYSSPTVTDFANACAALAARYGAEGTGQLRNYQIWNEPNHSNPVTPYFGSVPFGAAGYASMLIAASAAIRAQDSGAFIISASLMSTVDYSNTDISPSTFLDAMYDAGAKDSFDAVGYNWYSTKTDFSGYEMPSVDQVFYKEMLACREIMVEKGDSAKQVWVTEFGVARSLVTNPVLRGEILAKQIDLMSRHEWVGCWLAYNWRDSGAGGTSEETYGFVNHNDFIPQNPAHDLVLSSVGKVKAGVADGVVTNVKIANGTIAGSKLNVTGTGGTGKFLAYAADGTLYASVPAGEGGSSLDDAGLAVLINDTDSDTRTALNAIYGEVQSGSAPNATVHADAGSGALISSSGSRVAVRVTVTTGIAPVAGGTLATLALSGYTNAPAVAVNPRNEVTASTFAYASTTTSVLTLKTAGELEPATAYTYDLIIMGV